MFQQSMLELEDFSNYSASNNHRVPWTAVEQVNVSETQGGCANKSSVIAGRKVRDVRSVAKNVIPGPAKTAFLVSKEGRAPMLEKDSWSSTPDAMFPDTKALDSCLKGSSTKSADKIFFEDDAMLGARGSETNSDLHHFPLGDMYPANGDLNIFGNEHENQDCSYLSYDGWLDISYIEDFDGLFRSCDSSFRQEKVTNDDEMSWFSSSSNVIDGSKDASEPGFKSFCSGPRVNQDEANVYHVAHSVTPNSDKKNDLSSHSVLHHSFYDSLLDSKAESISEPVSEKQNGALRRTIKNHKQTEGKRKYQHSEYSSGGHFLVPGTQQQQFANPTKRSTDSSPNVIALRPEKNVEKLHLRPHLQAGLTNTYQHEDLVNFAALADQVDILTQLHQIQNGVEGQFEVQNVSTEHLNQDTDSSVILESSGVSSVGSGKISAEETNFQQLQCVMEQLDFRTKLCIRDSLYRLARSAEQRNNLEHSESGSRDEKNKCGVMTTQETNKFSVFMDVETDTNPIDRSIAHLLFHRPIEGKYP